MQHKNARGPRSSWLTLTLSVLLSLLLSLLISGCHMKSGFTSLATSGFFDEAAKSLTPPPADLTSTAPALPGKILFSSDFESGTFTGWAQELAPVSYAAQFVDSPAPVRSGAKALRIELHQDDPDVAGSRRSELARGDIVQNGEYWYAFSIYLPTDYATDRSQESLAQWHNYPDFNLGETWMSPPLALITSNGHWMVNRLWDDGAVSSNATVVAKGFHQTNDLGSNDADKGRWTDWVFHIKWGWVASQDPKLEVYKNGVLVLNQNGMPNTTNDVKAPYFKIGIYKWDWKEDPRRSDLTTRVLFIDRVLIGDQNCKLKDLQ